MFIFLIIGLVLGAFAIIFAAQNVATITVVFLAWKVEGSLALIVILAIVCGMLISYFLSLPTVIQRMLRISKLKQTIEKLKDELVHKETVIESKEAEIEAEKSKLAATNAYVDDLEKNKGNI